MWRRLSHKNAPLQNIPLVAIEGPHPGAVYFGANDYEAGLIGGQHLATWAKNHWKGNIDEIILMEQAVMGQNAAPEAWRELRRAGTRLIGSVAYFPEKYGQAPMRIGIDLLNKKKLPPAVFCQYRLKIPQSTGRNLIGETLAYVATSRPRYDAQTFTDDADRLTAALSRCCQDSVSSSARRDRRFD